MTNQESIKILSQVLDVLLKSNSWLESTHNPLKESFGMAISALENSQRTGKWIKIHWKAFRCSECKGISEYYTDFCPNCGAKMRGEA